jgi:hypothetical protein
VGGSPSLIIFRGSGYKVIVPRELDFESLSAASCDRVGRRRMRLSAVAILLASIVAFGLFAGQARAGGSAAHDQYTPPSVPGQHQSTPPGAQASAPIASSAPGGSTLPFTGLSLLRVVLLGVVLLVLGVLLRRGVPRRGP